jgi:hypothetical protein
MLTDPSELDLTPSDPDIFAEVISFPEEIPLWTVIPSEFTLIVLLTDRLSDPTLIVTEPVTGFTLTEDEFCTALINVDDI